MIKNRKCGSEFWFNDLSSFLADIFVKYEDLSTIKSPICSKLWIFRVQMAFAASENRIRCHIIYGWSYGESGTKDVKNRIVLHFEWKRCEIGCKTSCRCGWGMLRTRESWECENKKFWESSALAFRVVNCNAQFRSALHQLKAVLLFREFQH